jgi:trans-AT polyketide synthase/acyltransferase/oxidoreductase domain-containing protein
MSNNMVMVGSWVPRSAAAPAFSAAELCDAITQVRTPAYVVREGAQGRIGLVLGGRVVMEPAGGERLPLVGVLPALYPEWLGDRSFAETHGVRFPYVAGEMANGIATTRMVAALARAELLGFFGAAGLPPNEVERAISELTEQLGTQAAWGVNLIHSPSEPELEEAVAELLIRRGVRAVSASAFMSLTPAVVRCAAAGLRVDPQGRIVRARQVFAKVSRPEVATHFMSPPPAPILRALVGRGLLSEEEARLAARLPVAEDITVEADSAGHTDNRPLVALLPALMLLRDQLCARHEYDRPIRIGAAGGICTPGSVAAAFSLGAAYVLTGSINQAAVESGLSRAGKELLAKADLADVAMAPSADMFELGVRVQVLKRGTLFAGRAARLYEAYVRYGSLEEVPDGERRRIETEILRTSFAQAWEDTRRFWQARDARELERAERDPKHRMALTFRSYLGLSSRWAISGDPERHADFQIWCGPAMGAFNRWAAGSFLAAPEERSVVQIALNLLEGAAVLTRAQQARSHGAAVPASAFDFRPRRLA